MNKLDTKIHDQSSSRTLDAHSELWPAHRLIVLVPDGDLDYAAATRRVWELANESGANIQFIGLCKDKDAVQVPSLRRQLVTMTAMVQDREIAAEAKVEFGNNWVSVVKSNWQVGDMIVCFAEQHAGPLYRPLSQILRSNVQVPIYILSGLYPQSQSRFNRISLIALWAGLISIIAGSFLLQIRIISFSRDWAQTTLLILSVLAEFWLIYAWNNLFS